jgi:hypothetical protein
MPMDCHSQRHFLEMSGKLKDLVSDFRDKHLAHQKNPRRMVGISWTTGRNIQLAPTYVNPKESDKPQMASSPLSYLLELINAYLEMLFSAIENNRKKSTFTIRKRTSGTLYNPRTWVTLYSKDIGNSLGVSSARV